MNKERFPADWAAAEILKQYMKNYRRHAVRKGRMERRAQKKRNEQDMTEGGRGSTLHNVDDGGVDNSSTDGEEEDEA
jgi:hypothetical protein